MITNLTLKKVASFDDNGLQITNLKKVNFFFGYNGSGKSTIARYIYNIGLDDGQKSPDFVNCLENGYDKAKNQVLSFDENFIETNFIKNPFLKGVFSLNQKNEEIDKQIVAQENQIDQYKKYINDKRALKESLALDKRKKSTALLDSCWSKRTTFSTFNKFTLIHSGSKPNHLSEIRRRIPVLDQILSLNEITESYKKLYEQELKEIKHQIDANCYKQIRRIENSLAGLLDEIIIGNEDVDIAALISTIDARSWVETGIHLIEKTGSICPFCQKSTIDDELKRKFNKYFDQTYKDKTERIRSLKNSYETKSKELLSNIRSIQEEYNVNNITSTSYHALEVLFSSNIEVIEEKLSKPNERKSIISLHTKKSDLSRILKEIIENNTIYSELDIKKRELTNHIWNYIASNCKDEIENFDNKDLQYQRIDLLIEHLIRVVTSKLNTSKSFIDTLRSQTVNTKDAVDNINLILQYSGFEGFEIKEKSTVNNISQYYLKRPSATNSEPVFRSLSEGEKNFISFLYFYQICLGTDDIQTNSTKKKIIVIDDPVSSLDCQALFIVSTLIQNLIQKKGSGTKPERMSFKNESIEQVFIFTHNIYFYKEVTLERRPICTDYWHFKLIKMNNITQITGDYNKTITDDYTLLWNSIRELKLNLPSNSSLNILIANTMRRVIETYVNFIGYSSDSWGALYSIDQNDPKYYIKSAFVSVINDESHKVTALDSIYYQKIINEHPQVLFDVFKEIFKTIGKEHYEMMLQEEIK